MTPIDAFDDNDILPPACQARLARFHERIDGRDTVIWCVILAAAIGLMILLGGCTAPSNTLAREGSARSDEVRSYVSSQQHRSLTILLFRETLAKLNAAKSDEERTAILNQAWNDRDLFEFWRTQDLLAQFTHVATVDNYLTANQSIFDLLGKSVAKRLKTPVGWLDDYLAGKIGAAVGGLATTQPAK